MELAKKLHFYLVFADLRECTLGDLTNLTEATEEEVLEELACMEADGLLSRVTAPGKRTWYVVRGGARLAKLEKRTAAIASDVLKQVPK